MIVFCLEFFLVTPDTHSFLMVDPDNPPICHFCTDDEELTVEHIMITCAHFNRIRQDHFTVPTMKELFEKVDNVNIINFIKEAGLY